MMEESGESNLKGVKDLPLKDQILDSMAQFKNIVNQEDPSYEAMYVCEMQINLVELYEVTRAVIFKIDKGAKLSSKEQKVIAGLDPLSLIKFVEVHLKEVLGGQKKGMIKELQSFVDDVGQLN